MTPAPIRIEARALGLWYDDYRRLRHRIFVVEQSWNGLSSRQEPGLTKRDPADAKARFWLARSSDGTLIGAVRVCAVADVFPHEELFTHHFAIAAMAAIWPRLGTLNSLLVDNGWRRRPCQGPDGQTGTVASLLLDACVSGCADRGLHAIVATAQTVVSARALMRAGFRVIDPPVRTPLHPDFTMCNVGIVLQPTDESTRAAARYFDDCQRRALGSQSIDACFAGTMAAVAGAA